MSQKFKLDALRNFLMENVETHSICLAFFKKIIYQNFHTILFDL